MAAPHVLGCVSRLRGGGVVGARRHRLPVRSATNSIAWNPCHHLLAFAGDDVQEENAEHGGHHGGFGGGNKRTHAGSVFVWGFKA
jgi:hypothetical protein